MMMAALRANELANERRKTFETERSNRAKERETERSNRAKEYETHRANVANETRQELTDRSVRSLNYEKTNTEKTQQLNNRASARKHNAEAHVTEQTGVNKAKAETFERYASGNLHDKQGVKAVEEAILATRKADTEIENKYLANAKTNLTQLEAEGQAIDNKWAPKMYKSERLKNTGSFIKNVAGSLKDVSGEARGWISSRGSKSPQMSLFE